MSVKRLPTPLEEIDQQISEIMKLGFTGAIFGAIDRNGGTVIIYNGNLTGLGSQLRETVTESKNKAIATHKRRGKDGGEKLSK